MVILLLGRIQVGTRLAFPSICVKSFQARVRRGELSKLRSLASKLRLALIQRPYNGLSRAEAFDLIYKRGAWGGDGSGVPYSGTASHDDEMAPAWVDEVNAFLATLPSSNVVDLGCGDYEISSRLICDSYIGCDISEVALASNRKRFPGVDFRKLDFVDDPLPKGDVAIIRAVLQHLNNATIAKFIQRQLPYEYLLVAEGVPVGEFTPNRDKPTGPNIRLSDGSGVVLSEPPFNFPFHSVRSFDVSGRFSRRPHVIRTEIYRLTQLGGT